MKKSLFAFSVFVLFQTSFIPVLAQKSGDTISGFVYDNEGPMMMVKVTERDSADNVVAQTTTDIEGRFSIILVNPSDLLKVMYVGYKTVTFPIDSVYFEIIMQDDPRLTPIDITSDVPQEINTIISAISVLKQNRFGPVFKISS